MNKFTPNSNHSMLLGGLRNTPCIAAKVACAVIVIVAVLVGSVAQAQEKTPITIATQTTAAPSGQIFDVLCRTNIFELNGFNAKCRGFTYGPPLGEALIAGLIDTAFGADAPALRMAARKRGTKILHRTNDWEFGILVRKDFEGKDLKSLKGKKLSGPFATGTFTRSMLELIDAGIKDPFTEITMFNQDISEQPQGLRTSAVDAVTTWHPMLQILVDSGVARVMWTSELGDGIILQGISGDWLDKHGKDAGVRFMKAYIMAVWWASNNIDQANKWFSDTSRIDMKFVSAAANHDRYLRAPHKDITTLSFELSPEEIKGMQRVMDYLQQRGLIQERLDVASMIDSSYVLQAQKEIKEGKHPPLSEIKVARSLYADQ